jgi:hypothetical protein
MIGNAVDGAELATSTKESFVRNIVTANANGIAWGAPVSSGNTVARNLVIGNTGEGLDGGNTSGDVVFANNSHGNGANGLRLTTVANEVVKKNSLSGNDGRGLLSNSGSGTQIVGNTASENAFSGIEAQTNDVTISGNHANVNGFLNNSPNPGAFGILAQANTPGSNNTASGNAAAAQCSPATLC